MTKKEFQVGVIEYYIKLIGKQMLWIYIIIVSIITI